MRKLSGGLKLAKRFTADESGATSIEYALIAASIGMFVITGVNALGTKINAKFATINTALK